MSAAELSEAFETKIPFQHPDTKKVSPMQSQCFKMLGNLQLVHCQQEEEEEEEQDEGGFSQGPSLSSLTKALDEV